MQSGVDRAIPAINITVLIQGISPSNEGFTVRKVLPLWGTWRLTCEVPMTIYLGSTPCEEECASVGDEHYQSDARIEIGAYIDQLNRTFHFHRSDLGIIFRKKREPHDFGGYYEVVVDFEGFNWLSSPLAYVIEEHTPTEWDVIALQEIILRTVSTHFQPEDLGLDGPLAWMKTPVVSVPQGRRMLDLVRKVRTGRCVSTNEVSANLALDPAEETSEQAGTQQFVVVLDDRSERHSLTEFECTAPSAELAIEQAKSTHPSSEVLMHFTRG